MEMEGETRGAKIGLLIALGGVVLLVVVAVLLLRTAKPETVPAPASFTRYTAADKSFVCASPAGWQTSGAAAHGIAGSARFESGPARIDIASDLAGSLMGDMAAASNRMADGMAGMAPPGARLPRQIPPVEKVHAADQKSFAARFKDYSEGKMAAFRSPVGEARCSEFTAAGKFPVRKLHGWRITILGGERRFTVVCQCPEESWPALKPAFLRVVSSLAPGGG